MEVDADTSPPDVIENTDISALVEILYEYTPRDLKALISSEAPHLIELPHGNDSTLPRQKADLGKLCLYLPRHILSCLLKEDERFWITYLVKAQKLLLHLTKLATKRGGPLAQNTFSNVPKMIDLCILAAAIGIQRMAGTENVAEFQASLEMFKQVFALLDYFLDSELRSAKQPFVDALIAHPKSYVLNDAIIDGLNLILQHRNILPPREDGKSNPAIARTLIAVFDVLDILAMNEEFVQKLLSKSQGYQLVDVCLHILKDYSRLGHPVLFATLKLLYRLCEEEATFLRGVLNSPACTRFNLVISHVIDVAADVLGPVSKLTHATRSEATKIIFATAREPSYRRQILEKGTPFFLKFLSLPPNDFSVFFKDAAASEMLVYVFASIGFLHAQPLREATDKSLLDHALACLQTQPSALLLKKAYSGAPSVYAPTVILNLNAIVHELVTNQKWREEAPIKITKRHVNLAISFRNDIEKHLGLSSSHFDALIVDGFAAWSDGAPKKESSASTTSAASRPVSASLTKPVKPKTPL